MGAKSCCTSCGGYACRGCHEGVICTMCLHGGRGFDSMEEVWEPQVQEHRQMKRGTAKLNQHGFRLAAALHDNGVHPRLVRNKLLCDNDTKATNVCRAAVQGTRREKTMPWYSTSMEHMSHQDFDLRQARDQFDLNNGGCTTPTC